MEGKERKFLRAARGGGEYEVAVIFGMGKGGDDMEQWILRPEAGMEDGVELWRGGRREEMNGLCVDGSVGLLGFVGWLAACTVTGELTASWR